MALKTHPLLAGSSDTTTLPNMMVSKKKKDDNWKHRLMDTWEGRGINQIAMNQRFIENYKLVNGEFQQQLYIERDKSVYDPIATMSKKLELPNYIRHYDIISQPLNTLVGEYTGLPEVFWAEALGDDLMSERERAKSTLLKEAALGILEKSIEAELARQGYDDPNAMQFNSEEERQQYLQELEEAKAKAVPEEYKKFDTKWSHVAERWANIQLKNNLYLYSQKEKNAEEFEDMLKTTRCFRHFYLTPGGRLEETWNPVNVFYSKGFDVEYPEDGGYIGRGIPMTVDEIISRYGHELTEDQIKSLDRGFVSNLKGTKDALGNKIDYTDLDGRPYNTRMAYLDTNLDRVKKMNGAWGDLDSLGINSDTEGDYAFLNEKEYWVTHAYWIAQEKIGMYQYVDPETGILVQELVNEDFIVPDNVREVQASFNDEDYKDESDIVIWTWGNELWEGKKISGNTNVGGANKSKAIYFGIKRCEFQCKANGAIWDKKLPVVGLIFNNRNVVPQSLVDLMKPYQIFYNVIMNYAYRAFEKQILPFVVMDTNLIPNTKDWGDRSLKKWMEVGQRLGVTVSDSNPQVTGGAPVQGGQFPRVVDINTTPQLIAYLNLAAAIKQLSLEQIGVSSQRLGDIKASETATGVQNALSRSYNQTSKYFNKFNDYKRRCLQMGLNFDQFVQSRSEDVKASSIHSDTTNQFVKLNGTDLLLADLYVFIKDSQTEADKVRLMKQFVLENNTIITRLSTKLQVLGADTEAVMKEIVREAEIELKEMEQRQQQMQQQQMQMAQDQFNAQIEKEDEHFYADLENQLQIAFLRAAPPQQSGAQDSFKNYMDMMKLQQTERLNEANISIKERELENSIAQQRNTQNDFTNAERIKLIQEETKRMTELAKNRREEQRLKKANQKSKN